MPTSAKAMVLSLHDLLTQPELVARARDDGAVHAPSDVPLSMRVDRPRARGVNGDITPRLVSRRASFGWDHGPATQAQPAAVMQRRRRGAGTPFRLVHRASKDADHAASLLHRVGLLALDPRSGAGVQWYTLTAAGRAVAVPQ
jgi:hypothetical protein